MHEPLWYPQQRRLHPRDLEETYYFAKDHQAVDKNWGRSAFTGDRTLDAVYVRGGGQPVTPDIAAADRKLWTPVTYRENLDDHEFSPGLSARSGNSQISKEERMKTLFPKRVHMTKGMEMRQDEEEDVRSQMSIIEDFELKMQKKELTLFAANLANPLEQLDDL